jgi:hypothetical protein
MTGESSECTGALRCEDEALERPQTERHLQTIEREPKNAANHHHDQVVAERVQRVLASFADGAINML